MNCCVTVLSFLLLRAYYCDCTPVTGNSTRASHDSSNANMQPWLQGRRLNGSRYSRRTGGGDSIVFPTDAAEEETVTMRPHIDSAVKPKACPDDSNFCEAEDYPTGLLHSLLQNSAVDFQFMFSNDSVNDTDILTHRIDDHDEQSLCESKIEIHHFQKGHDRNGKVKFIVNQKPYYQTIRQETCVFNEESACTEFGELVPFGYETYCKQKYIQRKMLALEDDGSLKMVEFPIPSCCVCVFKSSMDSFKSRFGFSAKLVTSKRLKNDGLL